MNLIIIACLLLVMQYALTFIQVRYYRKSMDKLINKYRGNDDFYLFSGQARRKLRSGSIAMLVVDKDYTIMECQVMKGVSVLTPFKELEQYKGLHAGNLLTSLQESNPVGGNRKKTSAMSAALMDAAESALLSISKKRISAI